MSKKDPLFNNEGELKAAEQAVEAFQFDEPRKVPKLTLMVSGPEGVGKTHLACTMSEVGPVYLIDTENKADIVIKKYLEQKRVIRHKVVSSWLQMAVTIKAILKTQAPGTIVIDSASDLQEFAEIKYLEQTRMDKIYPVFNWSEVWGMCNALINSIRFSQHNLVLTTRIKEQYIADKSTGVFVPRVYKNAPHLTDIGVQFMKDLKPGFLTKNGFKNDLTTPIPRDLTFPQIIELITKG